MTVIGESANAIAYGGTAHPHDPSDLLRCMNLGWSTEGIRRKMTGRSPEWDRLLPHWDNLITLLQHEIDTRSDDRAPRTYAEMERVLAGGVTCAVCDGTGRGVDCVKCKGSGMRCGGYCHADGCYRGAMLCTGCHGRGYVRPAANEVTR